MLEFREDLGDPVLDAFLQFREVEEKVTVNRQARH